MDSEQEQRDNDADAAEEEEDFLSPVVVGFGTDDEWDRENMTPSGL